MTDFNPPETSDILIVEDSATQAEHLRQILEKQRHNVRAARHGREALDRLRENRPLLVISDINMPEMDGYELCRQIRADPTLADLPIILLTSLSDPDDVVLGLESGADNFVTKPVDEEYLHSRIRYIMANRHLRSLEGTRISLEISLRGRKHNITADRLQMLHLLLSTYESAMLRSRQLADAQQDLRRLNESLEEKIRERTASLTAEVAERSRLNEELRQSEAAMRISEERFRRMFHSSPVAKSLGRLDEAFVEVNAAFCTLVGYSRAELIGHTGDGQHLWHEPQQRASLGASVRAGEPVRNREIQLRRKSGEIRTALLSLELLQFDGGADHLATWVDITEQKALTAQLNRIQRLESVGQLAGGIAHDMNNILAPIMMGAPLLRMNLPSADVERTLATIEMSAQRGADLVRQLTIFSRGAEGERRPVKLSNIVTEVTTMAAQTFPKNIAIAVRVADDTWPVHGDTTQLLQVLLNLFVNARDAMPVGGELTLTAGNTELDAHYAALNPDARPGKYVVVRVTDTGTGIPRDIVDRIFDPFFTTKEIGQGTGLGLSNVLGIVKGHGGFVRVQSEPGRGTTFEIHLPASTDAEPTRAAPGGSTARFQGNGELILVVDDEENVRSILRATLTRHNYRVLTASDGVEATAVFASNPEVSLVISDLDMPVMDGIGVARVLRQMNHGLPILISSGWTERRGAETRREQLKALGIETILIKPYTAEKLLETIRHALSAAGQAGDRTIGSKENRLDK